jgi:hypothetical protein
MLLPHDIGATGRVALLLRRSVGVKKIAACVLALGLLIPSAASADGFSATFAGTGLGAGVSGYSGGSYFNVFAGQIKWDAGVDEFLSFCLQLDSPLKPEQYFDTSMPAHISAWEAASISYLVTKNFASLTSNWMAAGLQLAIWNVLYDSDYKASDGVFRSSTSNATYFADKFLADLGAQKLPFGSALFLNSQPGTRGQDQVTLYSTPEPGTMLLLGAGALALVARRRMARKVH